MEYFLAMFNLGFGRPWWLLSLCLLLPLVVWIGVKKMATVSAARRTAAVILRCLLVTILVLLLSELAYVEKNERLTVIGVIDRSLSIPRDLRESSIEYLSQAVEEKPARDLLAVVDVAEASTISKLPSSDTGIRKRNTMLKGDRSRLSDGMELAMAIAPPDTAVRILLVSDGNQTSGDLIEAARISAINKIPIDVLPLRYEYDREVLFKRIVAPAKARSGETVSLRFVMESNVETSGKIMLNENGDTVDLDPDSTRIGAPITLEPGTSVKTVSLPLNTRGVKDFEAVFVPDDESMDMVSENNRASAMTFVSGPGHVLVVDADGSSGQALLDILGDSDMRSRYMKASAFPGDLARLLGVDAVMLVNVDASQFTYHQKEMLVKYVEDLGGGLIMVGGPGAFGAGGWIGSDVAGIMPVDFDPPQKKQLPKGALVLIVHSCEMPQGNLWGERVAIAAVSTLSRLDLVGVLAYIWRGPGNWVYPLSEVGDKTEVMSAIKKMQPGDMPDLGTNLQDAYNALTSCNAAQKHVIVISDGDPAPPSTELLDKIRNAGISCSCVAVFPHQQSDLQNLMRVAQLTGGRFYNVKDPRNLPRIFIKEAQVVKRSLINERTFTPKIEYSLSEMLKGLNGFPKLDGYVLTGRKSGLSQTVLTTGGGDPLLAGRQSGLGRCVAFTSSMDSRWAASWLAWGGAQRFWEQVVRWVGKPAQSSDCEIMVDVDGKDVMVNAEAMGSDGELTDLAAINGQVISPGMSTFELGMQQVGVGQYRGDFTASSAGSYIVNLQYRKPGEQRNRMSQAVVSVPFAPEFRDLSDNSSLLNKVADITGGKVLSGEPSVDAVYDYNGLVFPATRQPLLRFLMYAWLVVFLMDVAVRRIVINFRSLFSKAVAFLWRRREPADSEETLDRLRARRRRVREQLGAVPDRGVAAKRYDVGDREGAPLPADAAAGDEGAAFELEQEPARDKTGAKETPDQESHISKLLDAKKRARDRKDQNSTKE